MYFNFFFLPFFTFSTFFCNYFDKLVSRVVYRLEKVNIINLFGEKKFSSTYNLLNLIFFLQKKKKNVKRDPFICHNNNIIGSRIIWCQKKFIFLSETNIFVVLLNRFTLIITKITKKILFATTILIMKRF